MKTQQDTIANMNIDVQLISEREDLLNMNNPNITNIQVHTWVKLTFNIKA